MGKLMRIQYYQPIHMLATDNANVIACLYIVYLSKMESLPAVGPPGEAEGRLPNGLLIYGGSPLVLLSPASCSFTKLIRLPLDKSSGGLGRNSNPLDGKGTYDNVL
jgi:hypothetical protein